MHLNLLPDVFDTFLSQTSIVELHKTELVASNIPGAVSRDTSNQQQRDCGRHECQILGRGLEVAESGFAWDNCEKNQGHEDFIPVQDFINHLPYGLTDEDLESLRAVVDLTVRIRVQWTSSDRQDHDQLSEWRGTDVLRLGTGFIYHVTGPELNEPCPCGRCDGESKTIHWKVYVQTALHVVFDTAEAKATRVDLFFNDETCQLNDTMKTLRAVEVSRSYPTSDVCQMMCVTHDETLAGRMVALLRCYQEKHAFFHLKKENSPDHFRDLLAAGGEDNVIIISHPHGQPKKITRGVKRKYKSVDDNSLDYTTPTCPGSSGAPVFHIESPRADLFYSPIHPYSRGVHSGSYLESENQVNFSSDRLNAFSRHHLFRHSHYVNKVLKSRFFAAQ